jgi:Tol biopolymer transport system component
MSNISGRWSKGLATGVACSILILPFTSLRAARPPLAPAGAAVAAAPAAIGKLAFASDRDGNFEIYVMDTDGGGQLRLTESPGEDYSPAWSPDGSRLAFVSTRDGNAEIYLMNADGTGQTRLTNNTAGDLSPVWRPDGAQIGFVSNRNGNDEIYLMGPDGSNQTNLSNNPADDSSFCFSPDGTMIALSSRREDAQFDIYRLNAAGGEATRLTFAEGDDINPTWSQAQISFQSNRDENDEIYSMDPDGKTQNRLTNNSDLDLDASQTSDGAALCFATNRDGNLEIYLMAPDGSGLRRLTTNSAADLQPALQPRAIVPPAPLPGGATVQFSAVEYTVREGEPHATLTVIRAGNVTGLSTVEFATVNGNASNRTDYTFHGGTLSFQPGQTSSSFSVLPIDDAYIEEDETLTITLRNPTGATLGAQNTAVLKILDNDTAQLSPNPIDNARLFVNQHYLDFLSREPDASGLDFWTDQITSCGNNLACLELRRINVSAAFYLSIEFQQTGYLVYRVYKTAYGDLPGTPVPVRLGEFLPDTQRIGQGVVVGVGDWQAALENNKNAFVSDFVMRPRFLSAYPQGLEAAKFVDLLNQNAGGALSAAERDQLVGELTAGSKTRAQVLRAVAEDPDLQRQEFNKAFVLMQYFGYLRRNPDQAPDVDFSGYNFWLQKLNQFNGNFINAEMVKAFIVSTEYRQRFGP